VASSGEGHDGHGLACLELRGKIPQAAAGPHFRCRDRLHSWQLEIALGCEIPQCRGAGGLDNRPASAQFVLIGADLIQGDLLEPQLERR